MQFFDIFNTCCTLHTSPLPNVKSEDRFLVLTEIPNVVTRVSAGYTVSRRTVIDFHRNTSRASVAFIA